MGKKGHLTFEKGYLIFGGGSVRIRRTLPDTPLILKPFLSFKKLLSIKIPSKALKKLEQKS